MNTTQALVLGFLIAVLVFVVLPIVFTVIKGLLIAAVIVILFTIGYALFTGSKRTK